MRGLGHDEGWVHGFVQQRAVSRVTPHGSSGGALTADNTPALLPLRQSGFNIHLNLFIKRKLLGKVADPQSLSTRNHHTIAMLTLVPSLSLSAMVSTSSTAGNALLNGRAAGSVGTPAVASFYGAGERPTWPALLARGGTGVSMAAADVAEITPDALAADPMFFDESKAIAELGFAISEEELLLKAKEYLYYGQGVARPELLASDFVFMGPFVGGAGGALAC